MVKRKTATSNGDGGSLAVSRRVPDLPAKPAARTVTRAAALRTAAQGGSALESKTLLESLGVLDDLIGKSGLVSQRRTLMKFQRSVMRQLATLHGENPELVAQGT